MTTRWISFIVLLLGSFSLSAALCTAGEKKPPPQNKGAARYAAELTTEYVAPAMDLIKRSLPLGELKGFRRIPMELSGVKYFTNIPFMFTECSTVKSKTLDMIRCFDEQKSARFEVARLEPPQNFLTEFSQSTARALVFLTALESMKELPLHQTPTASPSPKNKTENRNEKKQTILDFSCKNLAAAYNVASFLVRGFNCRFIHIVESPSSGRTYHILIQADNGNIYDFSVWYQEAAMGEFYDRTPMVALHSLRQE